MKTYFKILGLLLMFTIQHQANAQRTKEYDIVMRNSNTITLWDGVTVPIFAFAEGIGGESTLPGPTIYAEEGDTVIITARNISRPHDHTIHLHGLDVDTRNDGDPTTSFAIAHAKDCTYTFVATHAGTYIYHCHLMDVIHLQMGMYGSVIVKAAEGKKTAWTNGPAYTKEYSWLTSELDRLWHDSIPKRPAHTVTIPLPPYLPTYFLINGKSDQQLKDSTIAVDGNTNQKIYLRLANIGYYYNRYVFPKSLIVEVIDSDGRPLPKSRLVDTLDVLPGERYGVMLHSTDELTDFIQVLYCNMNTYQIKNIQKVDIKLSLPQGINTLSFNKNEMLAYPNPTTDLLHIKWFNNNMEGRLKLINNQGTVILEEEILPNSTLTNLMTNKLQDGIYLLEQIQGDLRWIQKIAIKKR